LLLSGYLAISHCIRPKNPPFPVGQELTSFKGNQQKQLLYDRPQRPFSVFFHLPPFAIAILCSYCYCLLLGFNKREMVLSERENTQLKTELSFLRSQISPHFMFNVLNSMVSLARKNSDLLEPSLINMSNLMRYMLYERNGNVIFLKTEIEYLRNYIDLQLLRYGDTVKLNMYVNGNFDFYHIEPMLLLPFVENAFKHGISMIAEPLIDIFLTVSDQTDTLQFVVLNNISPVKDMQESETGIGLQNIKRRLELLYPGKHKLNLSNQDEVFKAEIIIKLT
jgi:LytS/YehU family sensor histidine kinase